MPRKGEQFIDTRDLAQQFGQGFPNAEYDMSSRFLDPRDITRELYRVSQTLLAVQKQSTGKGATLPKLVA